MGAKNYKNVASQRSGAPARRETGFTEGEV